jgi:hypothetical protein
MSFNFEPATGRVVVPNEDSKRHINPLFPSNLAPIVTAQAAGLPETLFYSYRKNFMPRLGFAFRPFSDARTVIRGGYGMYTDQITDAAWNNIVGGPYISDETFTNSIVQGKPAFMFPRAFPAGFGSTGVQNFTANDPHLRPPVIQQWNFTIEREVWDMGVRVSYIGTDIELEPAASRARTVQERHAAIPGIPYGSVATQRRESRLPFAARRSGAQNESRPLLSVWLDLGAIG